MGARGPHKHVHDKHGRRGRVRAGWGWGLRGDQEPWVHESAWVVGVGAEGTAMGPARVREG